MWTEWVIWCGGLGWVGGSISEPHGAALLSWLVLRLWLGRTGGWKSLPLSKCVPPPTMRAAALSHLLPVAGCICRAAGGCLWADDSAKLRSLSAAGSTSALGAVRPVAASARIRAQLLPPLPSPPERSNPHAGEGAGAGASYNGCASTVIYHLSTSFLWNDVWGMSVYAVIVNFSGIKRNETERIAANCHGLLRVP